MFVPEGVDPVSSFELVVALMASTSILFMAAAYRWWRWRKDHGMPS